VLFNKPGHIGGNPMKPTLKPAMVHVKGRMNGNIRVRMAQVNILIQGFRGLLVRVSLQGKQIIGCSGDNPVGYFIPTSHSVYRDDTAFQGYHLQQGRYRRDFIALFPGFHLGKHQPILRGPGAHQMDGLVSLPGVTTPPDGLPVYGVGL
jgi:hypothetical protein